MPARKLKLILEANRAKLSEANLIDLLEDRREWMFRLMKDFSPGTLGQLRCASNCRLGRLWGGGLKDNKSRLVFPFKNLCLETPGLFREVPFSHASTENGSRFSFWGLMADRPDCWVVGDVRMERVGMERQVPSECRHRHESDTARFLKKVDQSPVQMLHSLTYEATQWVEREQKRLYELSAAIGRMEEQDESANRLAKY